jgi:type III secretion protein L
MNAPTARTQLAPQGKILRREEVSLWSKGEALLARTRVHADAILAMAHVSADEERMRGFSAGVNAARSEQAQLILDMVARRDMYLGSVEKDLIGVVANAVRKIVGEFDDFEKTRIAVAGALKALRKQAVATIRVGPSNYEEIRASASILMRLCPNLEVLEVEMDPRLKPGACTLISDIGVVETDIETQIRAIESAIGGVSVDTEHANTAKPQVPTKLVLNKTTGSEPVWQSGGERRKRAPSADRRRLPVTVELEGDGCWLSGAERRKHPPTFDRRGLSNLLKKDQD